MDRLAAFAVMIVVTTICAAFIAVRYRKMYESMFKDRLGRAIGSVRVHNSDSLLTALNVRTLGDKDPPEWVALEVAFPNRARWNVQLKLSRDEVVELTKLLSKSIAPA
jgi:hypothetical protein